MFQLTRPVTRVFLASAAVSVALGVATAQLSSPAQPPTAVPVPGQTARIIQFGSPAGGSYLGIGVQDVDAGRLRELKLKEERGVEVTAVEEDSPAGRAGLRKGDVVLEMNGQRVEGVEQFVRMVREMPVGREAKLQVSRNGEVQTRTAKVAQRKSWTFPGDRAVVIPAIPGVSGVSGVPRATMPDMPRATMSWRNGSLGVEAEALKGGLAEFFGVKQGVLIRAVSKGSPAEKAGLKAGDVIVRVNEKGVGSPADVSAILRERGDRKAINVVIMREKREVPVTVTLGANLEDEEHGGIAPAMANPPGRKHPRARPARVRLSRNASARQRQRAYRTGVACRAHEGGNTVSDRRNASVRCRRPLQRRNACAVD